MARVTRDMDQISISIARWSTSTRWRNRIQRVIRISTRTYFQTKCANILMGIEWSKRSKGQINAYSLHPGNDTACGPPLASSAWTASPLQPSIRGRQFPKEQ
ncbi:hypothetical protein C8R47DRAFT_1078223 [Mycena vitilis]|nr:hypothetical protein C8R47DRAFT_1078223 [Mycena vitilis]